MRIFCSTCNTVTNHEVVKEFIKEYTPENTPEMNIDYAKSTWQIVSCRGCDNISFRELWVCSEDYDPYTGEAQETESIYPKRGKDELVAKPFYSVPIKLRRIYREVIDSYNYELYTLCTGGLRAIIEGICAAEGVIDGPVEQTRGGQRVFERKSDLRGKIEGLHEKALLTKKHAETLHEHRLLGNYALHELDIPSNQELRLAIEIIEHTLDNIYELQNKAEELRLQKNRRQNTL